MTAGKHRSITIELPVEGAVNSISPIERLTVRVPQAAQLLSVSRAAVYRLLSAGEIEASKSGQKTLIHVSSIKDFIERTRVVVTSAPAPEK